MKVVESIIREYFYACSALFICFFLAYSFDQIKMIGYSIFNLIIMPELSPLYNTLSHGLTIATLSIFAWNFIIGAGVQIFAGLFGRDTPQFVLVGRAAVIGLIYGATFEGIMHSLESDLVKLFVIMIVVLMEFLAYSIATHGGVEVGRSISKLENGTRSQRIITFLIGPLPFTYKKVKHKLKTEIKYAVGLCPIIVAILLLSAILEIWLIIG